MVQVGVEVDRHVEKVVKPIETFLVDQPKKVCACVLIWKVPHHRRRSKLILVRNSLVVITLVCFAESVSTCGSTRCRARIATLTETHSFLLHQAAVCNAFGPFEGVAIKR